MQLGTLAMVACLFAAPAAGRDAGVNNARTRIEAYLSTHDVPTLDELRALAPIPEKGLIAIASDVRAPGLTRSRAVAAMRLVPSPLVREFLSNLLQHNATATDAVDRLMLRRAAVALGWIAGTQAVDELVLLFENDDADVRLDAVVGLGLSRAIGAADHLRKQLAVEPAPRVRAQIERQLSALAAQVTAPAPDAARQKAPAQPPMRGGF